jgi:hypothetical protein
VKKGHPVKDSSIIGMEGEEEGGLPVHGWVVLAGLVAWTIPVGSVVPTTDFGGSVAVLRSFVSKGCFEF